MKYGILPWWTNCIGKCDFLSQAAVLATNISDPPYNPSPPPLCTPIRRRGGRVFHTFSSKLCQNGIDISNAVVEKVKWICILASWSLVIEKGHLVSDCLDGEGGGGERRRGVKYRGNCTGYVMFCFKRVELRWSCFAKLCLQCPVMRSLSLTRLDAVDIPFVRNFSCSVC